MITSAARQENNETSKFMRWRVWEKSMIESIQSPKLRTHCSRWRTTPLQKINLFFSGFDLHSFKPLEQSKCWKSGEITADMIFFNRSKLTCTRVAGWRAQRRQIQGAAPGPLCRSLWILGWFQPSFWSHPRHRSGGHKTAGCHQHPLFLSDCSPSPGTEEGEDWRFSATERIFSETVCCLSASCNQSDPYNRALDRVKLLRFTLE